MLDRDRNRQKFSKSEISISNFKHWRITRAKGVSLTKRKTQWQAKKIQHKGNLYKVYMFTVKPFHKKIK